jgi:alpha-L-fucosidase 2
MERRDFLKTSGTAAGLLGTINASPAVTAGDDDPQAVSTPAGARPVDNRPARYLRRAQSDPFLPTPPAPAQSYSIAPMPLAERVRRQLVPQRGFCSIAPADAANESLVSGNGAMRIELMGDPYAEQILFHHESLLMPWTKPVEAPDIADILPRVRQLELEGKHADAMALALRRMSDGPIAPDAAPHLTIPAFLMRLESPKGAVVRDYLRTVDFESAEVSVHWSDERGDWVRRALVSRPDNVVVQWLTGSAGRPLNIRVSLHRSAAWSMRSGADWGSHPGIGATSPDRAAFNIGANGAPPKVAPPKGVEACEVRQDGNVQRLIYACRLDPSVDNSGYAGVVRVVRHGGSARMDGDALVIENASSVMLLTRIEYFADFAEARVEALRQAVDTLVPDYAALLGRARTVQSEMLNRVTVEFGGTAQYGMATEELLADQRSRPDYAPALLNRVFEMGRYWFIVTSGRYPGLAAEINATIDLQTAGAAQGDLREGMEAYFAWIDSLAADYRTNAKRIFGLRGSVHPLFPDKGIGASFYYTGNSAFGLWPYWISAGGWRLRQFWDHFLVTGDVGFLRNRVVPALKDLALFYEGFLTATDENGNYVFVPSISPENLPSGTDPSGPALVNATMDIAVCREVLTHLIQASEILGDDADSLPKWRDMLAKMPPYLHELDGTLKEWAWPTLQERYAHRHVSHLYGAWPGDEIDPDRTPQLARAAVIACRRRSPDVMATAVAGETLPAYGRCHRALVGARLKDNITVDVQLRQLLEQGYVSSSLRCSREPYGQPVPDAHGGIGAIVMEMLLYSRPGLIEVLPALPEPLRKGSINGMLARTFARIDRLAWDMDARTVELRVTSFRKQDITLMARHGIEAITASAGVLAGPLQAGTADIDAHLPQNRPVTFRLRLGRRKPLDWAARQASGRG